MSITEVAESPASSSPAPSRLRGNLIAVAVIVAVLALTVLSFAMTRQPTCHGWLMLNDHGRGAITEWLPNCRN